MQVCGVLCSLFVSCVRMLFGRRKHWADKSEKLGSAFSVEAMIAQGRNELLLTKARAVHNALFPPAVPQQGTSNVQVPLAVTLSMGMRLPAHCCVCQAQRPQRSYAQPPFDSRPSGHSGAGHPQGDKRKIMSWLTDAEQHAKVAKSTCNNCGVRLLC
jgi:hypothetical protein